jgi:choline dehydrogenase-like flavoprotein
MPEMTSSQADLLRAVCDTVVPSVPHVPDPYGVWRRSASDQGTDQALAQTIAGMPEADQAGLAALLDALAGQGFAAASRLSREQLLRNVSMASADAAAGVAALTALTLLLHYGAPDPTTGQNPNWPAFGFEAPAPAGAQEPRVIVPLAVDGDLHLTADVVVIGSGAGGGVMAGELAQGGAKVILVEAGGHFDEADFNGSELWAYQHLYWRGGPTQTADMNLSIQAGACLGGGTVINWTNSLRTTSWVREEWANEHGLADVGTDFDRHLDAVWQRLGVNRDRSELNGPQRMMERGAQELGWSFTLTDRNTDRERYDPRAAGLMGFGDMSGAKNSTLRTYLRDAVEHGADVLVETTVERILVDGGRAAGVEARHASGARVTISAPQVVLAAGALESPAVLLRSGIGGPAVGRHLRLHPCTATFGRYGEAQDAHWGPPHAALVDEFAPRNDGYGFLLEGAQYTTGLSAMALPWTGGEAHKALMDDFRFGASFIGLARDRGDDNGRIELGPDGQGVPFYALADPRDQANTRAALDAQIRLHAAAGANRIVPLAATAPTWHRGDDLEAFIRRVQQVPLRAGAMRMFAAHQMGTCRMGSDPATSVATPDGELHDTPGVWIGDTSAFPTASGTNPMITVMALAHRTAERIRTAAGAAATPSLQEA